MRLIVAVVALATAVLSGCGSSKMRGLSDDELAEKHGQCLDEQPSAPGRVQACENLSRECDRRRIELSNYICRAY